MTWPNKLYMVTHSLIEVQNKTATLRETGIYRWQLAKNWTQYLFTWLFFSFKEISGRQTEENPISSSASVTSVYTGSI